VKVNDGGAKESEQGQASIREYNHGQCVKRVINLDGSAGEVGASSVQDLVGPASGLGDAVEPGTAAAGGRGCRPLAEEHGCQTAVMSYGKADRLKAELQTGDRLKAGLRTGGPLPVSLRSPSARMGADSVAAGRGMGRAAIR
jgi:hypothetical protein